MTTERVRSLLERLDEEGTGLFHKDFLLTWSQSQDELETVLVVAEALEESYRSNLSTRVFESGLAVANFRDESMRTRFSFASAASLLGLTVQDLRPDMAEAHPGDSVREASLMVSFLTEVIGIRDGMLLGVGHNHMTEVVDAVDDGFRSGLLSQRPAVINLQSDIDHPTQTMADLLHLQETFGSLEALRGKKIAMTWAYSPSDFEPLSVPQGIIGLMTRFGMHVSLAHPEGYDLLPEVTESAARFAQESGGSFSTCHSMEEAFRDADVVYPQAWSPVSVLRQRTRILRTGEVKELDALRKASRADNAKYRSWECDEKIMGITHAAQPVYMRSIPASITGVTCEAGDVSRSVFDRHRQSVCREASRKPFIVAAMIMLARFDRPGRVLADVLARKIPRKFG